MVQGTDCQYSIVGSAFLNNFISKAHLQIGVHERDNAKIGDRRAHQKCRIIVELSKTGLAALQISLLPPKAAARKLPG